jgi:hypothetical protein
VHRDPARGCAGDGPRGQRRGCRIAVNGPDACDHPLLYLEAGATAVLVGEGEFAAAHFVAAAGGRCALDRVPA